MIVSLDQCKYGRCMHRISIIATSSSLPLDMSHDYERLLITLQLQQEKTHARELAHSSS